MNNFISSIDNFISFINITSDSLACSSIDFNSIDSSIKKHTSIIESNSNSFDFASLSDSDQSLVHSKLAELESTSSDFDFLITELANSFEQVSFDIQSDILKNNIIHA
jgi:hypothetical protein